MIYLQCKLIPKGIQSIRYMNIGEFETVSDANAAARGLNIGEDAPLGVVHVLGGEFRQSVHNRLPFELFYLLERN